MPLGFGEFSAMLGFSFMNLADVFLLIGKFPQPGTAVHGFASPRADPDIV